MAIPAHRTVYHDPAVVEARGGGVEGMKRLFAWRQRQQMCGVETERGAAVLPDDPAIRQYDAAAKLMIKTLNKGDRQPAAVHHPHPDGVAGAFSRPPGGGLPIVDVIGQLLERLRVEQALNIHVEMTGVGNVGIAQAKSLLGGLDDTVHGLRVIGIVHRQPVGNPEDRQRDQSLRWRRQIPQFAVLVLKLQRRRATGAMLL